MNLNSLKWEIEIKEAPIRWTTNSTYIRKKNWNPGVEHTVRFWLSIYGLRVREILIPFSENLEYICFIYFRSKSKYILRTIITLAIYQLPVGNFFRGKLKSNEFPCLVERVKIIPLVFLWQLSTKGGTHDLLLFFFKESFSIYFKFSIIFYWSIDQFDNDDFYFIEN